VALFVVPVILGIIYLPALLSDVFGQYQELLDFGKTTGSLPSSVIDAGNNSSGLLNRMLK